MQAQRTTKETKLLTEGRGKGRSGMKVRSRVKAGSVPDAPDRWRNQIQIVARGL